MTQTREFTGIEHSVDLNFTYRDVEQLTFASLIRNIQDLRALVAVGHLMLPGHTVETSTVEAEQSTEISRFTYNSPIEVLVTIFTATGAALAVVNRVLATHKKFQDERLHKSNVDVAVLANEVIKDELRARRGPNTPLADGDATKSIVHSASQALANIERVEMRLSDEDPKGG